MSGKLWGGRFASRTHPLLEEFGRSLASDSRLVWADLSVCQAHLQMLSEVGVVAPEVASKLTNTIAQVRSDLESGQLVIDGDHEDIHSWVESVLKQRAGEDASLIRLGRSRNDLVVTDFRLWTRQAIANLKGALEGLQLALLERAEQHQELYLPGYTHLQRAQPVSLSHHLLAHFWALQRDFVRLGQCAEEADCCPLGAGALAGSSWPILPQRSAEILGFSRSFENSLDAVSDRDFAVSLLAALSLMMIHLSRLSEELILWSAPEFGFVVFDDAWSTGSSLMPQKKNPDPAELTRGRTGRVIGHLQSLLVTLKGLPLAYNRDLQEDKPPVFEACEMTEMCLKVCAGVISSLRFDGNAMASACQDPGLLATDLADALVRAGRPFSVAHELAGKWVAGRLTQDEAIEVEPLAKPLSALSVLQARSHPGAAGPASVSQQLVRARTLKPLTSG
jgi:argininosuccinate lyase